MSPISTEKNIDQIKTAYAAFGRGDVPAVLEHFAEDLLHFGMVSELGDRVPWHFQGTKKADVARYFGALNEGLEFTRFEPRDFAAGGDHVYCTISYDITVRKTGKKATYDNVVHRFTLKNGRVVGWYSTDDTAKTAALLGV